jgi:hypothetical protein
VQGLPMHAPVPSVSCPEELSDMDGSFFSGIDAPLGASSFQQALYFHPSSILETTPWSGNLASNPPVKLLHCAYAL